MQYTATAFVLNAIVKYYLFMYPRILGKCNAGGLKFRYAFKLVLVFPQNHLLVIYLHSHSLIIRAYGLGP
jgi:hypothetical protein